MEGVFQLNICPTCRDGRGFRINIHLPMKTSVSLRLPHIDLEIENPVDIPKPRKLEANHEMSLLFSLVTCEDLTLWLRLTLGCQAL